MKLLEETIKRNRKMNLFTLTEITEAFAKIDGTNPSVTAPNLKELQNLTQRFPLAPSEVRGRAFLYSFQRVVSIRVAHEMHRMGLSRHLLMQVCEFMISKQGGASLEELEVEGVKEKGWDHAITISWSQVGTVIGVEKLGEVLTLSPHLPTVSVPLFPIVNALSSALKVHPTEVPIVWLSKYRGVGRPVVLKAIGDLPPARTVGNGTKLFTLTEALPLLDAHIAKLAAQNAKEFERNEELKDRVQMTLGGVAVPYLPTTAKLNFQKPSEGM